MNKNELITCECHSEVLSLTRFENESEIYFVVYKYHAVSYSFFRRILMCFDVLHGKGINTTDLVISEENFNKIKQF